MPCGAGCSSSPCPLPAELPAPPGLCATQAVALAAFDDAGRITEANTALARLLGQDAAALPGRALADFTSPAGRVILENHLLPLLRLSGQVDELALQLRPVQGGDLVVMCSAVRRVVAGVARNECAFMRMTERKRIEAELLRVKRAVEHVPGALFQLLRQHDGRVRMPLAGAAVHELFGLAAAPDGTAEPFFDSVAAQDLPRLRQGLEDSARQMAPWRAEFRVRLGDTLAWRAVEAQPRPVGGGDVLWHGYASDISGRKALEAAQIERDAARRASRAKSAFMARASHELRTPLNAVLGLARALAQDGTLQGGADPRPGLIEAAGRSLLRLVDEMLDIAALDAGQLDLTLAALPLAPLLRRCVLAVQPRAQAEGLALRFHADAALAVRADPARLEQVLQALLDNALRYNRPQGWVRLAAHAEGTQVCITVADGGHGLDAQQCAQLFQPFDRLGAERRHAAGAGLSLVAAKGLAELMNGRLEVQSQPGLGSRFSVWLDAAPAQAAPKTPAPDGGEALAGPAAVHRRTPASQPGGTAAGAPAAPRPAPAPDLATAAPQPPAAAAGPRHVLYVEDNPLNVLVMESLLAERPQWRLRVAGDVASAEAAALSQPPQLLLLDMHLPDGHGIELLRRLRAHAALRAVPAIAVSADVLAESIRAATVAGFDGYWTKPLDGDEVLQRLDALLGA